MSKATEKDYINSQIEDLEDEITELKLQIEDIENYDDNAIKEYDEMIDEQGDVEIGTLTFLPSQILKELDKVAYRCGYNDYFDERLSVIGDEISEKEGEIEELKKEIEELKQED